MATGQERIDRLEIVSAVVLSVAALGSSWAAFEAGVWDGEQAAHYTRSESLRVQASRTALEGDTVAAIEVQMFTAWLQAKVRNEAQLADFYQARFPASFKPAFKDWLAERPLVDPSAAPSPFSMPSYQRPGFASARQLDAQADKAFAQGQYDRRASDAFQQGATVLALALFFGGIGQVFKVPAGRIVLLTIAVVALAIGFLRLFSLPTQVLGFYVPGAG
jgi:hypothetical protein